jgi:hypothetical protein
MAVITMPVTITESDSFVGRMTESVVNGWTGVALTPNQAFAASVANLAIGTLVGGYFGRSRALKGLKPIAGFIL